MDLQIKFQFYGGLIGGGAEVMGREPGIGKMVMRLVFSKILSALTVFYMVLLLSSPLGQNMGGGHDRWNNGDELFTCSAAGQCLGTQAVIHKLSGRHITDRLNSRPVFEANLSANES